MHTVMRDVAGQPGDAAGARRAAGELEAGVLAVLQAAGQPLPPGEVRERVGGGLAYTTVVTILSRLHAKGVLQRRKAGRGWPPAGWPGCWTAKPTGRPYWPGSCPAFRVPTRSCCAACSMTRRGRPATAEGDSRCTWRFTFPW